jgi:hypothetical protein
MSTADINERKACTLDAKYLQAKITSHGEGKDGRRLERSRGEGGTRKEWVYFRNFGYDNSLFCYFLL